MKRRDFFTRMALGTAAVAVAPHILAQEPVKALDPYRNVVNNPYYKWVKAKRSEVHTKDNNYWKCLEKTAHTNRKDNLRKDFEDMLVYGESWYHTQRHAVSFRDYNNVYSYRNSKNQILWMNIEDYGFYETLNEKRVFDPHYTNLLGVGLVSGLVDPLNPRALYPNLSWGDRNPSQRTYPVDSYEIHIMYQKIK